MLGSLVGYVLLALAPVVAVAYIVWAHRKRVTAQAAASSVRFDQLFGNAAGRAANPALVPAARAPARPVADAMAARVPAQPLCLPREALLDARHKMLFAALRLRLPDHEVLAQVSLAAVVDIPAAVPGRERAERQRIIAQYLIDCLVCDKDMRIVAAVDREGEGSAEFRFKSEYLKASGVRYLRFDPAALPSGEALRTLLLG